MSNKIIDDAMALEMLEMKKTMTYKEIASHYGVSLSAVHMALRRRGMILPKTKRPKDRECPICGKRFGGDERKQYCSKQCKDISCRMSHSKAHSAKSRYKGDIVVDKDINLKKLYKRDKGICYICGSITSFNDKRLSNRGNETCGKHYPSIDHIIPIKAGGLHSWDNVRLACLSCNQSKGSKTERRA